MKVTFRSSFNRDLKKIRDKAALHKIREIICKAETASDLSDLRDCKKISGDKGYYRIRTGDYRVGVFLADNELEFVRCLHRRDIYRVFP